MNTNEPMITVNENTTLEEIMSELDKLGLLDKPKEIVYEYRIYYDVMGTITSTAPTAQDAEMYNFTGDYILVDETAYMSILGAPGRFKVHDGKIVLQKNSSNQTAQLERSNSGFTTVKNMPGVLLESGEEYQSTEKYDYKNS